jgi:hypothetical protein
MEPFLVGWRRTTILTDHIDLKTVFGFDRTAPDTNWADTPSASYDATILVEEYILRF